PLRVTIGQVDQGLDPNHVALHGPALPKERCDTGQRQPMRALVTGYRKGTWPWVAQSTGGGARPHIADNKLRPQRTICIASLRGRNLIKSHSPYVALWRRAKQAAVFSAELGGTFVAYP